MSKYPQALVLVFSGKRKCGKDFTTDKLVERLSEVCEIRRLSAPLKKAYADEHGLDYEKLLTAGSYKELYREDMIKWGVERREADPGYFARLTTQDVSKEVLIISDARRKTDVEFFLSHPKWGPVTRTVRIESTSAAREHRGWAFTAGVDDVDSECGLDDHSSDRPWDIVINNNEEHPEVFENGFQELLSVVTTALSDQKLKESSSN